MDVEPKPSRTLLVVDDEPNIISSIRRLLRRSEFEVLAAGDGQSALAEVERRVIDFVLLDLRLPDLNGIEVLRRIRRASPETIVIIITGHGTLDMAIKALKLGAQGFLLKPFTTAELRSAVADALEKTRLLNENIRMRALMPLFEVSKEIITETDTKKLLGLIINIAVRETGADRACIFLIDEKTGEILMEDAYGFSPVLLDAFRERQSQKLTSRLMRVDKPVIIVPGLSVPEGFEDVPVENGSGIFMPLTIRGKVVGILFLSREGVELPFSLPDAELVSILAGQAAAAIENAHLYQKLEQSYLSTIITLSAIAESKDFYTDKHMKEIAEYSVDIARKLGLPESDVENIRMAALLHDLGKVMVPDDILKKPGRLSEEEMEVIRNHPSHGAKMIESIEPLKDAREIIRHHHEYYDGSGYPDGLKGEAIPLGARIIAVADAFDAMTTNRPYRKALPMEKVIRELREFSGIQFDPHIVAVFISLLQEKELPEHA